jgi:hypothetical protein
MQSEDEIREAAVACYAAAEKAADELRATLAGFSATCAAARDHLAQGGDTQGLADIIPLNALRSRLTDELARFETARLGSRTAVARVAQSEGRRLSDLAREWGVSRQYVWQLVRDGGATAAQRASSKR